MANLTLLDEMKEHLTINDVRVNENSIEVDRYYPFQESCDTTTINHTEFSQWLEREGRLSCPFYFNEGTENEREVPCVQTYEQYLDGVNRQTMEADIKDYLFTNKKAA